LSECDRKGDVIGLSTSAGGKKVVAEQGYLKSRWTLNKGSSGKQMEIRERFCSGGNAVPVSWESGMEDESRDEISYIPLAGTSFISSCGTSADDTAKGVSAWSFGSMSTCLWYRCHSPCMR
jgi:hypothetical protein